MFISEEQCVIPTFRSSCGERIGMWISLAGVMLLGLVSCIYSYLIVTAADSNIATFFIR